MNYIHRTLVLLFILALLTGCTGSKQPEAVPSTEPPTEVPITEATEPPTEAPTERALSAFEIFNKCNAAAPDLATQYTTNETLHMRTGAAGVTMELDISVNTQAKLSREPFAINIQSETFTTMIGMEVEQTAREYYRKEGEDIVSYFDIEQLGLSFREVLPKELYPEVDKEEFPEMYFPLDEEYLFVMNSEYACPPDNYAEYMDLEPETQIINGREVYVLRYEQTALWLFGSTGDGAIDADLGDIRIPTYWYVDAETFMPIKLEYTLKDLDPLVTAAMVKLLNIQLPENAGDLMLEISEYTYTLTDMGFDPVEVPDIPEEILQRAEDLSSAA